MRIIGVTGGIGSGKSTVTKILSKLGAKIIDADMIARKITNKGEKALKEMAEYFGFEILNDEGELDRKRLADIVFNDEKKLKALNRITHKYISQRIKENIADMSDCEVVVVDAAIPLEHGFLDVVEEIWVVTAAREIRIKRVMERSLLSYNEVEKRIFSQLGDDEYMNLADKVIINDGNYEELENIVHKSFVQGGYTCG